MFAHQIDDILVVPIVQCPLGDLDISATLTLRTHLEVLTVDTSRQLGKQRRNDFGKLCRLDDIQDLLHLVEIHDLFWRVYFRPIPQQPKQYLFGQILILFQELHDAIGELWMIQRQRFRLVQR